MTGFSVDGMIDQSDNAGLSKDGLVPQAIKKFYTKQPPKTDGESIYSDPSGANDGAAIMAAPAIKQTGSPHIPSSSESVVIDENTPEIVITASRPTKTESLIFPDGLINKNDVQSGPYIVIKAYEYKRKIDQKETNEPLYRIYLPMPPNVAQGYQAQMENFSGSVIADAVSSKFGGESGIQGAMLGAGAAVAGATIIGTLQNKAFNMFEHAKYGQAAQNIFNSATSGDIRSQFSSIAGLVINPRYEVSFSSMGLRKHNFSFVMVPLSESESKTVNKIVKQLRYSAHPAETVGDFILSYPDKFIIEFRDSDGNSIDALPYLPDCMIDGFEVNTVVGRMHKNDPVSTTINISFTEQHTLTRKSKVIDY